MVVLCFIVSQSFDYFNKMITDTAFVKCYTPSNKEHSTINRGVCLPSYSAQVDNMYRCVSMWLIYYSHNHTYGGCIAVYLKFLLLGCNDIMQERTCVEKAPLLMFVITTTQDVVGYQMQACQAIQY